MGSSSDPLEGPGDAGEVRRAGRLGLGGDLAAEAAFRIIVRDAVDQVAANARLLRRERNVDAVHQARVGLRRLRAALSAFKAMVADDRVEAIKAEARWAAGALDAAREIDVLIAAHGHAGPAATTSALEETRRLAYDAAQAAMASPRLDQFLSDTLDWAQAGPWTTAGGRVEAARLRPLRASGRAILDRLHRRVCKAGRRFDRLDAEGRHQLRLAVKKLRYAAEFLRDATARDEDAKPGRFIKLLKGLQDELGVIHDLDVAARQGHAAPASNRPDNAAPLVQTVPDYDALVRQAGLTFAAVTAAPVFW